MDVPEEEDEEELPDIVLDLEIPVDTRPMIQLRIVWHEILRGQAAGLLLIWCTNMKGGPIVSILLYNAALSKPPLTVPLRI